ncbi:MAG TPA: M23 family metallopeptidase [Pedococcus sp.]|nr:M23 family metallopeptidase [Pedococcus sp.]
MPRRPASLRRLVVAVVVLCALGVASPALAAPGDTDPNRAKQQVDREIAALQGQLEDVGASLANVYIALRRAQAALPVAHHAVERATAALTRATLENDEMSAHLEVAKATEARALDELSATRQNLSDSRVRVARFAAQLYQDQGMGQLSVALSATTPEDFANRVAMTDTVLSVQSQSLTRLATAQAAATAEEAHLAALQAQVSAAKRSAEAALVRARAARAAAAAAQHRLQTLAAVQVAQTSALRHQKVAEQAQLTRAQRQQARLQAVLMARARAEKAAAAARAAALRRAGQQVPVGPSTSTGFLSPPSDGWISSEFGMRYHPILHYWRLHAGRDYAANCGTPVRAAADGQIISAGVVSGYGNRIEVDHGIVRGVDLVTTYNHLERFAVTGGSVRHGQVIGYVGTTGESTGCHLHFETYEDGVPRDPRRWL